MSYAAIHPAWDRTPTHFLEGYSLEMTAKERASLLEAAPDIAPDTPIAVPFLPADDIEVRVFAAKAIRMLGFEPMPHLSARRIADLRELSDTVRRCVEEADVKRILIIAGDPPTPLGPFEDTMQLLETGVFESNGLKAVGIGGHPGGHPVVDDATLWRFLELKVKEIEKRGMAPLIVTQFSFDAEPTLEWLTELRRRGISAPVRIGVPGPANIKRLIRFAKFCGVGASTAVLKKYGVSIGRLIGQAGPDKLVDSLRSQITSSHGPVRLHFYPFGGIPATVNWINNYNGSSKSR